MVSYDLKTRNPHKTMKSQCKCSKKKRTLSDPGKIERSFHIPKKSTIADNVETIDQINAKANDCIISNCKSLRLLFGNGVRIRDTNSIDERRRSVVADLDYLIKNTIVTKRLKNREIDKEKKLKSLNDPDFDVPWTRKELLENIDIKFMEPNFRFFDYGNIEKLSKELCVEMQKMCPYTPNGIKKKRYFSNEFLRLNFFELPKNGINYGINLVSVRRNFLQSVFPDIVELQRETSWFGMFEKPEIKENEPSLFAVRLLELVSTMKYETQFLSASIKNVEYEIRVNEVIEYGFMENLKDTKNHELLIIILFYIEQHLKGIITKEIYDCLDVLVNEKSSRIELLIKCMPYMLGNLKFSMMNSLCKCLVRYTEEFDVPLIFVFSKTCKYFVEKNVKNINYESFVKLCKILTKDNKM